MKMWISKYALTDGVRQSEGEVSSSGDYFTENDNKWSFYKIGREVHTSREAAVADAEARRKKKIASLCKQLAKLEALKF